MKVLVVISILSLSSLSLNSQVGIGTSSPTVELDIESSGSTTSIDINNTAADGDPQINFQLNNTTTYSMGIDNTDDFFKIGTTAPATSNMITLNGSGQLGIGTETPSNILDIESSAATTSIDINNTAADGDPQINFQLNNTTTYSMGIDDTDDFFKIGTTSPATSNMVTLNGSGQLGIGTEAPSNVLDLESDASTTSLDINNTAADGDPQINFQLNNTTTFSLGIDDTDDIFKLGTTAPGTSTIMAINSSGQVGIGTSSPTTDVILDLTSTSQAMLLTRLTAAQAGTITGVNGMILYVTSTDVTFTSIGFWGYEGGSWVKL